MTNILTETALPYDQQVRLCLNQIADHMRNNPFMWGIGREHSYNQIFFLNYASVNLRVNLPKQKVKFFQNIPLETIPDALLRECLFPAVTGLLHKVALANLKNAVDSLNPANQAPF